MLTLTLLGTADAAGIPVHGCDAPACAEARRYPWLRRLQSCVLVKSAQAHILLDMGNEAHMQRLYDVPLDAVFVTHLHIDHVAGLIALRWTRQPGGIPVYYPEGSSGDGESVLGISGGLRFQSMQRFEQVTVKDVTVAAVPLRHGDTIAHGYAVASSGASAALLTDTCGLPEETFAWLAAHRPDVAMVDSCYEPGHPDEGHNNVDTAIDTIKRLGVRQGVLTHIAPHNWPYFDLVPYVRERDGGRTVVSYDGMTITL